MVGRLVLGDVAGGVKPPQPASFVVQSGWPGGQVAVTVPQWQCVLRAASCRPPNLPNTRPAVIVVVS